jgi:hypothetical protein
VPEGEYVWDYGDHPAGRHPGFYTSLNRSLFDSARHRTFCYPITFNEQVRAFDKADGTSLFSLVGGITSGLRSRLFERLSNHPLRSRGIIKIQTGPWMSMFDRSGLFIKREFADSLRLARFVLCPRGNGVGSVRLFETMMAERVPVIISDDYVLPAGVDWERCAVIVKERDMGEIPDILAKRENEWEGMACAARQSWEDHFSPAGLFGEMARHLAAIKSAGLPTGASYTVPLVAAVAKYRAKSLRRKMHSLQKSLFPRA